MKKLIMSRVDHVRILKWVNDASDMNTISVKEAENLLNELNSAKIVEPRDVPANLVTMNSEVKIRFLNTNKQIQFRIVYPDQADVKKNRISIFSPVATALIGNSINDEIEWLIPSGMTTIRIEEILYQPEAAGDYTL
ncbi:MAG: nucleoside diphosphate kinase regulator [Bacteroidales bacterium]|jgi:regulator of nucleoside diphosphate kinase|nr:nucleoside diphosphate kinase regulator [Bacteroidales bacterium]